MNRNFDNEVIGIFDNEKMIEYKSMDKKCHSFVFNHSFIIMGLVQEWVRRRNDFGDL